MKLPMCYFCLKTRVLCPRCQSKVERGELTELDFLIAEILVRMEGKLFPELRKVTYHRAYRENDLVVVIVSGTGNTTRPPWNKLMRKISEELGSNVRFVEKTSNIKIVAEEIITPGRLLGVNTLWLPDGTEENTIRIPRSDARRLPARPEIIERLIKKILGVKARIVLE